jgi:phage terminase large subunit GpA-like protein
VVDRWFDAYKDEEARHDFLNSDCAVPYEIKGKQAEASKLKSHILKGHHRGQVPPECVFLCLTVDVHDDHLRYRIRGHSPDLTSWGIEEGQLPPQLSTVDALLCKTWTTDGRAWAIGYGIIDARWRTDEVYQLCLRHEGRLFPVMGQSQRELYKYSRQHVAADPSKGLLLSGDLTLVNIEDGRWKDLLFSRWEVAPGDPGAWYVEEEASEEYFWQLQGEVKVAGKNKKTGKLSTEWRQVHDNHALDVEKYPLLAADIFQVSSLLPAVQAARNTQSDVPQINPYTGQQTGGN